MGKGFERLGPMVCRGCALHTKLMQLLSAITPALATIGNTFEPIKLMRDVCDLIAYMDLFIWYVYGSIVASPQRRTGRGEPVLNNWIGVTK